MPARVLKLQPTSQIARDRVWELGSRAHIVVAADTLSPDDDFDELLPELNRRLKRGASISSRESTLFNRLLDERLKYLSQKELQKLYKLAMLPDEFMPELAHALCGASNQQLSKMMHLKLVAPTSMGCRFLEPVRSALLQKLTLLERRRTLLRLHAICVEFVKLPADLFQGGSLFPNRSSAEVTVAKIAEELARDPGNVDVVLDFITVAASSGYGNAVYPMRNWVLGVLSDAETPQGIYLSVCCMGMLELGVENYAQATEICEKWLPTCTAFSIHQELQITGILTIAWHRMGDTEKALDFSGREAALCRTLNLQLGVASSLRFRAELLGAAGRTDEMFSCLHQALEIYTRIETAPLTLAECNYQMADALIRACRHSEAYSYLERALEVRTHLNDVTGMAQCLCLLAEVRAFQNHEPEALMHVNHAILLCDAIHKPANRAAALLIKSSILNTLGLSAEAVHCARQALSYWESVSHPRWIHKCQNQLAQLSAR